MRSVIIINIISLLAAADPAPSAMEVHLHKKPKTLSVAMRQGRCRTMYRHWQKLKASDNAIQTVKSIKALRQLNAEMMNGFRNDSPTDPASHTAASAFTASGQMKLSKYRYQLLETLRHAGSTPDALTKIQRQCIICHHTFVKTPQALPTSLRASDANLSLVHKNRTTAQPRFIEN